MVVVFHQSRSWRADRGTLVIALGTSPIRENESILLSTNPPSPNRTNPLHGRAREVIPSPSIPRLLPQLGEQEEVLVPGE